MVQFKELLSGSLQAGAKVIYQSMNQLKSACCHTVIKYHLHHLSVTLLNNSVELFLNLDKPVP